MRITVDTSVEKSIIVNYSEMVLKFKEYNDELYYLNMLELSSNKTKTKIKPYSTESTCHSLANICLLNTVNNNKSLHTKKQIKLAKSSRKLQQHMGFPGNDEYKSILRNNCILNSLITVGDFKRSLAIFGTAEPILKGIITAPLLMPQNITTMSVPI